MRRGCGKRESRCPMCGRPKSAASCHRGTYTISRLAKLLGVPPQTVRRWIESGWFGRVQPSAAPPSSIPEAGVIRFLCSHSSECDLARINQPWLRYMVCAAMRAGG